MWSFAPQGKTKFVGVDSISARAHMECAPTDAEDFQAVRQHREPPILLSFIYYLLSAAALAAAAAVDQAICRL